MTQDRFATLGGKPLRDPLVEAQTAQKNRTPADFWLRANSLSCPIGKDPGKAFVLLTRRDFVALGRNDLHSLVWTDGDVVTTFPGLVIVRAECMNLSFASDPDSVYLVELADKRLQLKLSAINQSYNVRVPAGPRDTAAEYYYPDSLNAGALWTWQTMMDDVWSNLPAIAGASPTLPYTPDGSPEGFRFIGVKAWESYCLLAERIGCAVRYNPLTAALTLIRLGTTQAGLAASVAALNVTHRVYTYDSLDSARADAPETIRVFFHRRALDGHGTEKDTPRVDNWEMNQVYSEDVASAIVGAEVGTVLIVWDDLPALMDSVDVLTNTAELAARAAEVAANVAAKIVNEAPGRVHYAGCVTDILPGSQVSKVVWRDYSEGHGLLTEIHNYPRESDCCGVMPAGESLAPPDIGRKSHPVYPDLAQMVIVYHTSAAMGEFVEANDDGLHPGFIVRVVDQDTTYLERIWILFTDNFEEWAGNVLAVQEWQYGPARLSGVVTSDGETYPLYRVTHGDRTWMAVNQAELTQGASVEIETWLFDNDVELWGETGITWDAWDWFLNAADTIEAGTKMTVKWHGPILVITAAYCSVSDDPYVEASF